MRCNSKSSARTRNGEWMNDVMYSTSHALQLQTEASCVFVFFLINLYASAALRRLIPKCVVFRWVEFGHPCHMIFTYTRILVTTQSFHPGDNYALHISGTHSSPCNTPREINLVLLWVTLPCASDEILPSSARNSQLYDTEQFPFDTVPSPSYRIPHNKNTAVFRATPNSIVAHIPSFQYYCELCIYPITTVGSAC
jgi:hypothetical protein